MRLNDTLFPASAGGHADTAVGARYFASIIAFVLVAMLSFVMWGNSGGDHFTALDRNGDSSWYQNYYDATRIEIQDRDILYHKIGRSIENARKADIVFLGHSMVLFGLDEQAVTDFEERYGIKTFNMASAGDGSGEFLWRIIQRWNIRPKLWIINADDRDADFFSVSIDGFGNSGKSNAGHVLGYGRVRGFFNVVARNIRWRMEGAIAEYFPETLKSRLLLRPSPSTTWRSSVNGSIDYTRIGAFTTETNPVITVKRDQNCHATPDIIASAQSYVAKIGSRSVLTLFPHTNQCPQRVFEIAQALNTSVIAPPNTNYTSFDQTHLDRRGSVAFTKFFLSALEKTVEFKALIEEKRGAPIDGPVHRLSPLEVCFSNTSAATRYLSLRRGNAAENIQLAAGQSVRRRSDAFAYVCSSDQPFGRDLCPEAQSTELYACKL